MVAGLGEAAEIAAVTVASTPPGIGLPFNPQATQRNAAAAGTQFTVFPEAFAAAAAATVIDEMSVVE